MKKFAVTPKDLVDPLPIKVDFGIICYVPKKPKVLEQYRIDVSLGTYFSHSENYYFGEFQDYVFVVVGPVYGCPHGTTVIEDMKFHNIETIIGLGFVGTLSLNFPIGTNVIANSSLIEYPLYYNNPSIVPTNEIIFPKSKSNCIPNLFPSVRVWTTNAIYGETQAEIDRALDNKCDVVNMETSGFFAVCNSIGVGNYYYVATVSDLVTLEEEKNDDECGNTQEFPSGDGHERVNTRELANAISGRGFVLEKQKELVEQILQFEMTRASSNCEQTREPGGCGTTLSVIDEKMDIYIQDLSTILKPVCSSHGLQHAKNVMNNAKNALKSEKISRVQKTAVLLAALLHDADDHKFFPNNRNYENARFVLRNKSSNFVDLVIEMISLVSCSLNGDSLVPEEYKLIPRYADRLEALGVVGIKRAFVYSKTIGSALILDETPRPKSFSELDKIATYERFANYNGKSKSMIDHYYDKLLHIGNVLIHNTWLIENINKQTKIMKRFVLEFCQYADLHNDLDGFVLDFITREKINHS